MVGLNTTNLGDQAQALRLLTQDISALNYQQPYQTLGTLTAPIPLALSANFSYVAGYNKYILYMLAPASGVSFNTTFIVSGFPQNLVGNSTVSSSTNWIISGIPVAVTTVPIYTSSLTVFNDITTTIQLVITDIASPVYTVGTAILKLVININLE